MKFLSNLFSWYFSKNALPYWAVLLMDSTLIIIAEIISVYLCNGGSYLAEHFWNYMLLGVCSLPLYWVGMRVFHTYSGVLRYSSFIDLVRVGGAVLTGAASTFVIYEVGEYFGKLPDLMSVKIISMTFIWAAIFMWAIRISVKHLFDITSTSRNARGVFIYGVRQGGISLAKSMRNEHPTKYIVKGFVTHEQEMIGRYLLGCRVYASDDDFMDIIKEEKVKDFFVSPLFVDEFRNDDTLVTKLTKAGVRIMMMQGAEAWDGKSDLSHQQLHEVEIEDLLPRDKIEVDLEAIGRLLKDQVVMVTGAAGSIGYEMVRQVAKFAPKHLVLVDQAETPMHTVRLHMAKHYPDIPCETIVSSISNQTKMEAIFRQHRPNYVFHAAAYKHVPMMEDNPAEAVQNNIYGTRVIADLAVKYGTKKFVMISTDKAVNPTNVMGCSKRICEIYCQAFNKALVELRETGVCEEGTRNHLLQADGTPGITQFVTTRFGNVLGSNGSVIPIFKKQIAQGGPVTVTHPDIIRFFMLIPEACRLVLEAGTMGNGGEIFIFDMGKPVRIADLAQRMIDLSGAKNIEIKFTGLRDGEKLYEEVLNDAEQTKETPHPKIKVSAVREYPYSLALKNEEELHELSFTYDDMKIVAKMKEIVPEYKSKVSKYEILDKD